MAMTKQRGAERLVARTARACSTEQRAQLHSLGGRCLEPSGVGGACSRGARAARIAAPLRQRSRPALGPHDDRTREDASPAIERRQQGQDGARRSSARCWRGSRGVRCGWLYCPARSGGNAARALVDLLRSRGLGSTSVTSRGTRPSSWPRNAAPSRPSTRSSMLVQPLGVPSAWPWRVSRRPLVGVLIAHGADVKALNDEGRTAFDCAVAVSTPLGAKAAVALLEAGASHDANVEGLPVRKLFADPVVVAEVFGRKAARRGHERGFEGGGDIGVPSVPSSTVSSGR